MPYPSNLAPANHSVIVLRLPHPPLTPCPYHSILKSQGLDLIECTSPEVVRKAVHRGCRVGILIINHDADLSQLEQCHAFVGDKKMSWVGLIARELITTPQMRNFIGENLFNFISTPADPNHILLTLRHAWGMSIMRDEPDNMPADVRHAPDVSSLPMVGKSRQMRELLVKIQKVARTDAPVLITGPSGTGKEVAARAIHDQSERKAAPFIAVNCGAIAPQLFQSELFGYEKGAFTGATQRKIGRIEAAQGGTLFLDEIGDMPFDMQVNLLRFLQEKTIERVGGTEAQALDVRILAATHVDLAAAVKINHFREDLYYRINVVCIEIPQLADRGEDIDDIARHYFSKFSRLYNKSLRGFSKAAMDALLSHDWPGNVRELVNRVQRATVMAEGRFIQPEDLGFTCDMNPSRIMTLEEARAAAESMMIRRALSQSRNRISRAASLLGVSRVTLYRLIDKYNLRPEHAVKDGNG